MKQEVIDKRSLETILSDQKIEIESRKIEKLCTRLEEQLVDLGSPQAQVIIGVRRCGKSTLCTQALQHSEKIFAYVDFDDERLAGLQTNQLNDILEVLYKIYGDFQYIFLDEIQNVEGWPLFVNRLLRTKMHVVLTGSNANLLSNDLATHLTGRSCEIPLYPFSFEEYCHIKDIETQTFTTKDIAQRRAAFDEYIQRGGFPELTIIKNERQYISNLVNNVLKRDIEQRYNIAFPANFENMANHLLNVSPIVPSISELADTFGFKSLHTVRNYIDYLKQAYILIGVKKYSAKSKMRITQEKLYAIDVALMNKRENAFAGDNLGWRLETIVLLHLARQCHSKDWDVYYLKDRSGECDFVVCDGNKVLQCIQVSYDISNEKTRKREFNGLLLAHRLTKCKNLFLITDHEYADEEINGVTITIRPAYEWTCQNLSCSQEGMRIS